MTIIDMTCDICGVEVKTLHPCQLCDRDTCEACFEITFDDEQQYAECLKCLPYSGHEVTK